MKAKNLMVLALVGLAFGGGVAFLLLRSNAQPGTTVPASEQEMGEPSDAAPGVEILSPTDIKRGIVMAIEGWSITIRPRDGEAASYEVSPTAQVDEILDPTTLESDQPTTRKTTFEAIEVGDNVELWFDPNDPRAMVAQAVVVAKF